MVLFDGPPIARRVMWAALAVVVAAFLTFGVTPGLHWALPGMPLGRRHVLWVTLTGEIVFAIYKWGVGGWSRYTPPSTVKATSADTVQKEASHVSTP